MILYKSPQGNLFVRETTEFYEKFEEYSIVKNKSPSINSTIEFIKKAHKRQIDKQGIAYWKHPVAVMKSLQKDASTAEKLAALLHDVIEDTEYTAEDLLNLRYTKETIDIVKILTHDSNINYSKYIESIINSKNNSAIIVKIADLKHNLHHNRINSIIPKLILRYTNALSSINLYLHLNNIKDIVI